MRDPNNEKSTSETRIVRRSLGGNLWQWVATMVAIVSICTTAPAQVATAAEIDPDPSLYASLGFGEALIADRWNLVRATVQPGLKPVSGTVQVSMGIGTTTLSSSAAPFVSVPGVATRVDQVIALPRETWYFMDSAWVRVSLVGDDGRVIRRLVFDETGSTTSLRFPTTYNAGAHLVGIVGRLSLEAAARKWTDSSMSGGNPEIAAGMFELWSNVVAVSMEADSLPTHPGAYEALSAVVIASSQLDRVGDKALESLMQWVRSGGRLIVVGQTMGRDLSRWSMADVFRVLPAPEDGSRVEMTPAGAALGWRKVQAPVTLLAPLQGPPDMLEVTQGPMGLGSVTYVVTEPERERRYKVNDVWRSILAASFTRPVAQSEYSYSAAHDDGDSLPYVLDAMVESLPSPGQWPMILIVGFTVLVGLLLGPVDWWWLKRRRLSHWAWATAIGWIGVSAVGAFLWPNVIRAGRSELRRTVVVDSVSGRDGGVETAWQTGITCMLTSQTGVRQFEGLPDRAMWRRVRAYESEMQRPSTIFTNQTVGAIPGPINMDIWTLNCFRDDAPITRAPWARIVKVAGGYEVVVSDAPAGISDQAMLSTSTGEFEMLFEPVRDGVMRGLVIDRPEATTPAGDVELTDEIVEFDSEMAVVSEREIVSWAGLSLSGVADRGKSMEDLLTTGRWAMVTLHMESPASELTVSETVTTVQHTTYRILAPIVAQQDSGGPRS